MKTNINDIKAVTDVKSIIMGMKNDEYITFIINDKDYEFNSVICLGYGKYTLSKQNDQYLNNKSHNHHILNEILDFFERHKPSLYV